MGAEIFVLFGVGFGLTAAYLAGWSLILLRLDRVRDREIGAWRDLEPFSQDPRRTLRALRVLYGPPPVDKPLGCALQATRVLFPLAGIAVLALFAWAGLYVLHNGLAA